MDVSKAPGTCESPGRAVGRVVAFTAAGLLVFASRARADFAEPRLVSDGTASATQAATGLDVANNAYISSVMHERIRVKVIGPDLEANLALAANGLGQGDPDFATSSSGVTFMAFSQLDENPEGEGREIYLTDNRPGSSFSTPRRVTSDRDDDYAPRLVLDFDSKPHIVWAKKVGEETHVVYWTDRPGFEGPITVARGEYPHLYVTPAGVVHVIYFRDNDLFHNHNEGGSFNHELAITTTKDPEASASIGVDPAGRVLVSYESRNTLYYVTKDPGGIRFRLPVLVDTGGVLDPRMRVRDRGQVTIVYEKNGDIYYVVGQSTFIAQPVQLTATEAIESHPSLEVDLEGNIHVSFLRAGEVYYTNNASSPTPDFSANPTVGEAPLTVHFGDLSSGQIQSVHWDFGDGVTSSEPNPAHTYTAAGKYTVSLTVHAAGATVATKVREDFIFVQEQAYKLRIPNQRVVSGQKEVWFPIVGTFPTRVQGYQFMGTYDPNYLRLSSFEFANSVLSSRRVPEWYQANDNATYFEFGVIFEFTDPIDEKNQYLAANKDARLLQIVFDVSSAAPEGSQTEVRLTNNRDLSKVFNIFIVDGFSKLPALTNSVVDVITLSAPYPRFFLRGDADGNGSLSITDAIRTLSYLFTGGEPPVCLDAADVNDAGKVDISSAVSILNFLFLGGQTPAVPFPNPGLDPTEDTLPPCVR